MSESKVSQVREAQDAWKKMMGDQVARMEQAFAEAARVQEQTLEQSRRAIDDLAKLSKDSVAYYGQLSAEWRKLTLEATRKAAELWAVEA
jgi:methyl-accepting chemotaxis protein